jgi:hypothetical protein
MRSDSGIDKGLSGCLQPGQGAFFVSAHETAITGDIRRQYRRKPSFRALADQNGP